MDKTLVIVESPAKAVKIQEYLGKDYVVLASYGHIADLGKGGKHGIGIDIEKNFKPHYVLMDDKVHVLNNLIKHAKSAKLVLLAGDDDREGTAICWHIQQRLQGINAPMKRVVFNQITKKAVIKAVESPADLDMNIVHSQEARRILDRLVGFTASPFLMNLFGTNLSAGRVQSVVTKMIIDRERAIEKFLPEEFWTIQVTLAKNNEKFVTKYSKDIRDEKTAKDAEAKLNIKEYVVSEVVADEEERKPFPPMVTSTLQRLMSKNHGFSADRTMKAAQKLYEDGHCTYLRTDSVRVSDDALDEVRKWIKDHNYDLPKKANVYKNKDAAQDAHECIRPTDINVLPEDNTYITDHDEQLVYETIWNYFVASQMMPAIYNTLKITAHVKGDPSAEVKASGKALKYKGHLEILGVDDDSKIEIPNLAKGDILFLEGKKPVKVEKKQTQPPPRFSEDKLIKEMVSKSIGRPATYADLLSKLTNRNYVEKKGSVFHATDLGKQTTDVLSKFFTFMDYNYTSKLERKLDEIESGKVNYIDMLKEFYPPYKKELDLAYVSNGGTLCDKCGSQMLTRTVKSTGSKFLGCAKYPKCSFTKNIPE
jgi:DNA topoisomerase I